MNPIIRNIIRTAVPAVVGAVSTYIAKLSMHIDPNVQMVIFPIATTAYYSAIHTLEHKYPKLSWLLGCLPNKA
jgi:hypothetical protein